MHTVNITVKLPRADTSSAEGAKTVRRVRTSAHERILEKKKVEAVNERLDIIRKALSILPEPEADQIYQDILSKKPAEIIKVSQPYISKSYSLKLIDSRMISDPQKVPSLRVPLPMAKNEDKKGVQPGDPTYQPPMPAKAKSPRRISRGGNKLSSSVSQDQVSPEEAKLKQYVDNFYDLNEKMYQLQKVDQFKPQKLKERLPVTISAKTRFKLQELERKNQLQSLREPASRVNLGFHMMVDADLYDDSKQKRTKGPRKNQLAVNKTFLLDKSGMKQSQQRMMRPSNSIEDDYDDNKNHNLYGPLTTGFSRRYKKEKEKYKTGVYLGRTKRAGEELAKIKNVLKPFYPALPMSNLSIVREFYQVFKERGSKLAHKPGVLKDDKHPFLDSSTNTLSIRNPN